MGWHGIRSRPSRAVSGNSSITTPGLPETNENDGMTVLGAITVPSSIRTQSLMIANLPYATPQKREINHYGRKEKRPREQKGGKH